MAEARHGYGYNAGGVVSAAKEKAQELTSNAAEMAAQAKEKVQGWASTAADKADEAKSAVGEGIESLGNKIRRKGPHQGMLGSATGGVADTMQAAGSYLQDRDFSEMGHDVTDVIRRYPIQSILVGIGLGFLLARATRS